MDKIGLSAAEKSDLFRVTAAVLHLGNICFEDNSKDKKGSLDVYCCCQYDAYLINEFQIVLLHLNRERVFNTILFHVSLSAYTFYTCLNSRINYQIYSIVSNRDLFYCSYYQYFRYRSPASSNQILSFDLSLP